MVVSLELIYYNTKRRRLQSIVLLPLFCRSKYIELSFEPTKLLSNRLQSIRILRWLNKPASQVGQNYKKLVSNRSSQLATDQLLQNYVDLARWFIQPLKDSYRLEAVRE